MEAGLAEHHSLLLGYLTENLFHILPTINTKTQDSISLNIYHTSLSVEWRQIRLSERAQANVQREEQPAQQEKQPTQEETMVGYPNSDRREHCLEMMLGLTTGPVNRSESSTEPYTASSTTSGVSSCDLRLHEASILICEQSLQSIIATFGGSSSS